MDLNLDKIAHKTLDFLCVIPHCAENNALNIKVLQVAIPIIITAAAIAIVRHKVYQRALPKRKEGLLTEIQGGLGTIKHKTEQGAAKVREGFKEVGQQTKKSFDKLIKH